MNSPNEKLAESLRKLREQQRNGRMVFRSNAFSRVHRERLKRHGFIQEVVKGWYTLSNPAEAEGDTTGWYASFFAFVAEYCTDRFGNHWHLSAEASLSIHAGSTVIPAQVLIHAEQGSNNNLQLRHGTSLFDYRAPAMPPPESITVKDGLRLLNLPATLIRVSPSVFQDKPLDIQIALTQLGDLSPLLAALLEGGHSVVAGRLAGALRSMNRAADADRIVNTLQSAGYVVNEQTAFAQAPAIALNAGEGACAARIRLMWSQMRDAVLNELPPPPGLPANPQSYLADVDDRHIADAYHSLSIEGYKVTESLIARIAAGQWNPQGDLQDESRADALAAKGYHLAFECVRNSVATILAGAPAGPVVEKAHHDWYMNLFSPSVNAGLIEARHLAGYRNSQVYIRNARHLPPSTEAVRQAMPALFSLLTEEPHAAVRAVLGHFIFVYIHPYSDGNGRIGRFLMNAMLASGGYPWTIIPVTRRSHYMSALEEASVQGNIAPFARFVADCISQSAP